ncbi:hypothetical protein [Cellulosimicrobium composti]|uniref:Tight adherence protein B n=1 Tax=Cellulosimicrobium composti TaxID=2672572 RepID=A0ABX0BDH1_9MICO|nr:hypothetical protein [Cellulosimicrobium composti]NDO90593.1 hypothetical protein [Cellulosimicrobium composti]
MVVTVVGLLVAVGVWCATARGGRSARSVVGPAPPHARRPSLRRRVRARAVPELVRVVVTQVGSLLRAGAAPGVAWQRAVGVRVDAQGVPRVADLAPHVGGVGTARALVAACRLAVEVGAPLAPVLDEVAGSVAADAEARAEREAALAGPRATARVLLWLPGVGVLLGYVLGADPLGTATDGGLGTAGVLLGLLLLLAGRTWSVRLVERARAAGDDR